MGLQAGRLLSRYVRYLGISRIFEIGTCAGIGAAYMCSAAESNGPVDFIGMEGVDEKREIAEATLARFVKNTTVTIVPGLFQETFESALALAAPLQFVYLDGWHKREPTVRMFNRCVEEMPNGGVIVVDDLGQTTNGMREAGKQIRKHPHVTSRLAFSAKEAFVIREDEP